MADHERQSAIDRIERTFEQIHRERMVGLPILNPHLAVRLVGPRAWQGGWLGVLVTPWTMNLIALPGAGSAESPGAPGSTRERVLPSGHYEFIAGADPRLGPYETCSLFSPMDAFADQETALAAAAAILGLLFDPPPAAPAPRGLSRRGLLRAALGGGAGA